MADALKSYTTVTVIAILIGGLLGPFYAIFVKDISGSVAIVGVLMAVSSLVGAIVSVPFNFLGDMIGQKPIVVIEDLIAAFVLYSYTFVTQTSQLYFLAVLMGVVMGMGSTHEAWLAKLTEGGKKGEKLGFFNLSAGLASGVAMIIGGYVIALFSFAVLFYVAAAGEVLQALLHTFVPEKEGKMGLGKTVAVVVIVAALGGYLFFTGRLDYLASLTGDIGLFAQSVGGRLVGLGVGPG